MKLRLLFVAAALALLALSPAVFTTGCSKNASRLVAAKASRDAAQLPATIAEALAELDELQCPPNTKPEDFNLVKSRLRDILTEPKSSKQTRRAPDDTEDAEWNRLYEFYWEDDESARGQLTWTYRNRGDYNQDGIVSIADVTPIAIHYGCPVYGQCLVYPDEDMSELHDILNWHSDYPQQEVINQDDVEGIGVHFKSLLSYYSLRGYDEPGDSFDQSQEVARIPFKDYGTDFGEDPGDDKAPNKGYLRYHWPVPEDWNNYYCVAGSDGEGDWGPKKTVKLNVKVTSVFPTSGIQGDQMQLTVNTLGQPPLLEYAWTFPQGATTPSTSDAANPLVTLVGEPGIYPGGSVTVENQLGATDTYNFSITIRPAVGPVIEWVLFDTPSPYTGQTASFSCNAYGTQTPLTYEWDFGGGATPATSGQQNGTVTLGDPGEYSGTLTVTDAIQHVDQMPFSYEVLGPPEVLAVEPLHVASNAENVTFTVYVDTGSGPDHTYEWDFDGAAVPDELYYADEPSVTVPLVTGTCGVYSCSVTVENPAGEDVFPFDLTVHDNRLYMTYQLIDPPPPGNLLLGQREVRITVWLNDPANDLLNIDDLHIQFPAYLFYSLQPAPDFNVGVPGGPTWFADGLWLGMGPMLQQDPATFGEFAVTYDFEQVPPGPQDEADPSRKYIQLSLHPNPLAPPVPRGTPNAAVCNFVLKRGDPGLGPPPEPEALIKILVRRWDYDQNFNLLMTELTRYNDGPPNYYFFSKHDILHIPLG